MSPYSTATSSSRLSTPPTIKRVQTPKTLFFLHPIQYWKSFTRLPNVPSERLRVHVSVKPDSSVEASYFDLIRQISLPITTSLLVFALLTTGAVLPEDAFAARSGGRLGGSAFRSRMRSMPRTGGTYRQYNYYSAPGIAPPLMGGYGYGLMPSFFFPIGFGGGFNIFITLFVMSSVLNAIKSFQRRRRDDEDDFDDMI
eukprot:g9091.t1